MHDQAFQFVQRTLLDHYEELPAAAGRILDVGGRDVNGTTAMLYEGHVDVLDIQPGRNVTIVADARTWIADEPYDLIVSTEALEHIEDWPEAVGCIGDNLKRGGVAVITAAADPRKPHNADGGEDLGDEWYQNVDANQLRYELRWASRFVVQENRLIGDVYAYAVK